MRTSFKLDNSTLVITIDSINEKEQQDAADLELALLKAYGYGASSWEWRKVMGVGSGKCVLSVPGSTADDVVVAKKMLAEFVA